MLQALYERGVTPEFLVATSGGGLSAAFVEAAALIPGVFPPVGIAHHRSIDGGVVNSTPISHAAELGAERIYVLPTQDPSSLPRRPPQSALDAAMYALSALVDGRLDADIAQYSQEVQLVLLPAPNPAGIQPTSFDHSGRLIGHALEAARACLASQNAGRHPRLLTTEVG